MEEKPIIDDIFKHIENGKLHGVKCICCGHMMFPPRKFCSHCGSSEVKEIELTGKGTVDIYTVIHVAPPFMKDCSPYMVGIVELDEGPRITGRLLMDNEEMVESGMRVALEPLKKSDKNVIAFKKEIKQ